MNLTINHASKTSSFSVVGMDNKANVKQQPKEPKEMAASLALSASGRNRARMLKDEERQDITINDAKMQIDHILDTVKNGGVLTANEKRILSEELSSLASVHQKGLNNTKLSLEDESVRNALKENFMQRQKIFADMQKEIDASIGKEVEQSNNVMFAAAKQEKEEKERIIEALNELSEDEEDEEKTSETKNEGSEVNPEEDENNTLKDAAEKSSEHFKEAALDLIEGNSAAIASIGEQSQKEASKERELLGLMDNEFDKIMKVLKADDMSTEEKLIAYNEYIERSGELHHDKEIQRIKKEFDKETMLIAKIQFNAHDDISDVTSDKAYMNSQLGTEFIKNFLI